MKTNNIIEQKITQFKGKTFSNSEDALNWWREVMRDIVEATCEEMLVEERDFIRLDRGYSGTCEKHRYLHGGDITCKDCQEAITAKHKAQAETVVFNELINQCCALQREKGQEIKNKLKL